MLVLCSRTAEKSSRDVIYTVYLDRLDALSLADLLAASKSRSRWIVFWLAGIGLNSWLASSSLKLQRRMRDPQLCRAAAGRELYFDVSSCCSRLLEVDCDVRVSLTAVCVYCYHGQHLSDACGCTLNTRVLIPALAGSSWSTVRNMLDKQPTSVDNISP